MTTDINKKGFATRQIHASDVRIPGINPLATPIFATSTFVFDDCAQGAARFAGKEAGYIYSRMGNPNVNQVAAKVAALEGAEAGLALSSGMGAVATALLSLLEQGDHIVADSALYGATFTLMRDALPNFGIETTFVDASHIDNVIAAIKPETRMVYFETPANPNLKVTDIAELVKRVREKDPLIIVVIDNTFATPYLQQPIALGVDVVIHSGTKYLNGHGDVISGFIASSNVIIDRCRNIGLKMVTGAVLGAFEAFLINRGLKTLDIRMEKHCKNAMQIAEWLEKHPKVRKVYYPGLKSFEGYEVAKKQMKLPGAIISFELEASKEVTEKFVNSLELITLAVSLGDAESLVEHPASMTHAGYSKEDLEDANISESLIRISVGLEDAEDIIADLEKHLAAV
ncbi:MAG: aminotransferase class V-fold PLP-dependent enzyme [Chloroflexi bacterium]|nr:aminotransferase class V-fold PLP-dependent enzyme [Chloroflexota bacterium]